MTCIVTKKTNHKFTEHGKELYQWIIPYGDIETDDNRVINFMCFLYEIDVYRNKSILKDTIKYWNTVSINNDKEWLLFQKVLFYKVLKLFQENKKYYVMLYGEEYKYSVNELFDEYLLLLKKAFPKNTLFLDSITSDINHVITKHKRFFIFGRFNQRLRSFFKQIIQSCGR